EQIVQKAVELGAARIVPVLTRRCISRPDPGQFSKKQQRLQKIAHAAAKQAGRGIIPEVGGMLTFSQALEELGGQQLPVMLYEAGGVSMSQLTVPRTGSIGVLVGSEGGFDPEEAAQARLAGIQPVWLGPRILRCETAPLTALSLLMYLSGNL
ncbi:RsmE family RNA methyltransferase, partial [Ruminococcus sp. CAG:379]